MQERFKQLLEEKNLSAKRFADLIEVNPSAMSHILNGRSKPGFDILDKIAHTFPDVNLNWLVSGQGDPYHIPAKAPAPLKPVQPSLFDTLPLAPQPPAVSRDAALAPPVAPSPSPHPAPPAPQATPIPATPPCGTKKMKRIIIFYDDGSFEDYEK